MDSIGPTLPPHLQRKRDHHHQQQHIGPALPPNLEKSRDTKSPTRPTSPLGPARPKQGPTLPTANHSDDDSDDEIVGPLPSQADEDSNASSAVRDFQERELRWNKEREEAAKPKVIKRQEWMLKPPEAGDILSSQFLS